VETYCAVLGDRGVILICVLLVLSVYEMCYVLVETFCAVLGDRGDILCCVRR
jgi:hypothetical protein